VDIRVGSTPHLPAICADAIQLEQLLLNLISNAVDAAALSADRRGLVTVHVQQRRDRAVVSVEDNGRGIVEEIVDRLFEPFETTKRKGMGLGLTLARQIMDAHGGELHAENRVPHGARFTVELNVDGPRRHDA
jgi:signal transduction histidine kinase